MKKVLKTWLLIVFLDWVGFGIYLGMRLVDDYVIDKKEILSESIIFLPLLFAIIVAFIYGSLITLLVYLCALLFKNDELLSVKFLLPLVICSSIIVGFMAELEIFFAHGNDLGFLSPLPVVLIVILVYLGISKLGDAIKLDNAKQSHLEEAI